MALLHVRAEKTYERKLRGVARSWVKQVTSLVLKHAEHDGGYRGDAMRDVPGWLSVLVQMFKDQIAGFVAPLVDALISSSVKTGGQAAALLGIDPASSEVLGPLLADFRRANVALVENAFRAYADDVRTIFEDPSNYGLRVEELAAMLEEMGNVSESRAALIARDQTLKLNGQINQAQQQAAGIDSYEWSTSLDERVRPSHEELEGTVHSWDNPPEVGHPGEDYQCRCVAIPVMP